MGPLCLGSRTSAQSVAARVNRAATFFTAEFGESEKRTLADFRRSTAVEAIAAEATPAALAHAMGNTLSASNALFATYCPVNLTSLRDVMEARRRGRRKLR